MTGVFNGHPTFRSRGIIPFSFASKYRFRIRIPFGGTNERVPSCDGGGVISMEILFENPMWMVQLVQLITKRR